MSPFNRMDIEKKRLRNQFTKDERNRLLNIMTHYAALLDDKNISILSRKEIWEIIEKKFNAGGHSGRTSAQLKKYWQNYKYHNKRAKLLQQEGTEREEINEATNQMVRMLADMRADKWSEYRDVVNENRSKSSLELIDDSNDQSKRVPLTNFDSNHVGRTASNETSGIKLSPKMKMHSTSSPKITNLTARKASAQISESNLVVSKGNGPASSVTVSVFCPDMTPSPRNVLLKNTSPLVNERKSKSFPGAGLGQDPRSLSRNGKEYEGNEKTTGFRSQKNTNNRTMFPDEEGKRSNILGEDTNYSKATEQSSSALDIPVDRTILENFPNSIERTPLIPLLAKRSTKRKNSENLESRQGARKILAIDVVKLRNNATAKNMVDQNSTTKIEDLEARRMLLEFSSTNEILLESNEIQKSLPLDQENVASDWLQRLVGPLNNEQRIGPFRFLDARNRMPRSDSTPKDLSWPLTGADETERTRFLQLFRKFVIATSNGEESTKSDDNRTNDRNEPVNLIERDRLEGNARIEDTNEHRRWLVGGKRNDKLRVEEPASSTSGDPGARIIKAEPEESDTESTAIPSNLWEDKTTSHLPSDHLVQVKLHCVESGLEPQIELQKLEMAEKRLKVKIAEMTVQETKLRIQSLNEERFRAKVLHELRIAQMTGGKVRTEPEYQMRTNPSQTSSVEDRARTNGNERDHQRTETFFQQKYFRSLPDDGLNAIASSGNNNRETTAIDTFAQRR